MARLLALRPSTIDEYVGSAMDKLGARSRSAAVTLAIEHGLIIPAEA